MQTRSFRLPLSTAAVLVISLLHAPAVAESTIAKWQGDAAGAYSLTFDDSAVQRIAQAGILEEYGLRGTFYANTGWFSWLGQAVADDFYAMADRGHEIGGHTTNHVDWRTTPVTPEALDAEILQDKLTIEAATGRPCVTFSMPFGYLDETVKAYLEGLFISARTTSIDDTGNVVGGEDWDIMGLTIAPYTPYNEAAWSDEFFVSQMRTYAQGIEDNGGWGVEMFHNFGDENKELVVTEAAFRANLADLTAGDLDLWIATHGEVARYVREREQTQLQVIWESHDAMALRLDLSGDTALLDEELTVLADVPDAWRGADVRVSRSGRTLAVEMVEREGDLYAMFDARPGGTDITVSIVDSGAIIWNDIDGLWGLDANWDRNTPPSAAGLSAAAVDRSDRICTVASAGQSALSLTVTGGTVDVAAGGELTVTRDILVSGGRLKVSAGTVTVGRALHVAAGGTVQVNGNGTLSVDGDVILDAGATLVTGAFGAEIGMIQSTGPVSLADNVTLDIVVSGGGNEFNSGTYTLIDSAGDLTGTFTHVTDLGAYTTGNGLAYDEIAHTVTLTLDMALNPADANLDGVTDVSDRIIWNNNSFLSDTTFVTGDFNNDGVTDVSDRIIWNSHNFTFATASPLQSPDQGGFTAVTIIPEPATMLILIAAALPALLRPRRS